MLGSNHLALCSLNFSSSPLPIGSFGRLGGSLFIPMVFEPRSDVNMSDAGVLSSFIFVYYIVIVVGKLFFLGSLRPSYIVFLLFLPILPRPFLSQL